MLQEIILGGREILTSVAGEANSEITTDPNNARKFNLVCDDRDARVEIQRVGIYGYRKLVEYGLNQSKK